MVIIVAFVAIAFVLSQKGTMKPISKQQEAPKKSTPNPQQGSSTAPPNKDIGAVIGGIVGDGVKDMTGAKYRDAPTVTAAIVPLFAGVGAVVSAALIGGSIALGAVAIYAFPVCVALFALVDSALSAEESIRGIEEEKIANEIDALYRQKKYLEGFNKANEMVKAGWKGIPYIFVEGKYDIFDRATYGDAYTIPLVDDTGEPTGQIIDIAEVLQWAYKPVVDAFLNVKAQASREGWNEDKQLDWFMQYSQEFAKADKIADALQVAIPWFHPGSLHWRPTWPPVMVAPPNGWKEIPVTGSTNPDGTGGIFQANPGNGGGYSLPVFKLPPDEDKPPKGKIINPKGKTGGE